ncbi:hypothetical protein [uncultured Bacteroides sp.]|jgi:hypothetical protein|uniref:hypothetical protein n=1 Tax=uncultured Bacteroides sp. TaxID=162156 RepID=UPI00259185AC|nr:hypothetical protein [uncultured Bacteroides sp.]
MPGCLNQYGDEEFIVCIAAFAFDGFLCEEAARYLLVPYRCLQVSGYDRSSVSPDSLRWFANNDGRGIVSFFVNEKDTLVCLDGFF